MSSSYPTGLDTLATNKMNSTLRVNDHPQHHDDLADAVNKIEAELGISPSSSYSTVAARLDGTATALAASQTIGSTDDLITARGGNPTPSRFDIRKGTSSSPDTSASPVFKVSRTVATTLATVEAVPGAAVGSDGSFGMAAITGHAKGTATNEAQPIGVYGSASNASTSGTVDARVGDAAGVYGFAKIDSTATATTSGAYGGVFIGQRNVNTAKAFGVEIDCDNNTLTDGTYSAGGTSDTMGIWLTPVGTADSAVGIQIQSAASRQFAVGLAFGSQGSGAVKTWSISDDSSSAVSLRIAGTHSSASISISPAAGPLSFADNYVQMSEKASAPLNGAANTCRLWCEDDGAGKTRLMAIFSSGAAQQIAIQP